MALVKVKVRTPMEYEGNDLIEGQELVMQRKPATGLAEGGFIDIVSAPLDPRNEEDKPLIDEWMAAHSPEAREDEELDDTEETAAEANTAE